MKLLLATLAATARAALVAKDRDHYARYWARDHENGRCDAKHCEWMRGFGSIDVGCRLEIDRAGLAGGPGPAFSLVLADNDTLRIDARDAAAVDRFMRRPALCEYVPSVPSNRNATGEVALLMVANAPAYLFRLWPPFLNKLLFATDAGLRPFLWLGDLPHGLRKPTSDACLHSREMRHILGHHRRLGRSYYSGHLNAGECSNHYVKMPATLATLAHPEIKGLYYLDLDAVIRFPWTHNGEPGITGKLLQEHQNGYSAVAFSRGSKANRFHRLRWQVHGERFYARDSAKGRAFFADWFNNRCTFQDQYSLWHTVLEFAAKEGCLDYDGEIYRDYMYPEVKRLGDETTNLILDCSVVDEKCPKFPFANVGGDTCDTHLPRLLDDVHHRHVPDSSDVFRVGSGSLVVENACFASSDGQCEYADTLEGYAKLLGIEGRDRAKHPWDGQGFDRRGVEVSGTCPTLVNHHAGRTIRVAVALYGLVRHKCPEANYRSVFLEPFTQASSASYEIDVYVAANTRTSTETDSRFHRYKAAPPAEATEYAKFAPCHASAVDQEAVELDVEPVLQATCGTYGDFWGDATCGTTRNFLSSLHAQRLLAQLIEGHERSSSQEYNLILVARLDVLFTDAIPTDLIQRLAVAVETRRETIITPDWGVYSHINDRFAFGTRTSMLRTLRRLDEIAAYAEEKRQPVGSEAFLKHVVDATGADHLARPGIHFRRVRPAGELHPAQYEPVGDCVLHTVETCDVDTVKRIQHCGTLSSHADAPFGEAPCFGRDGAAPCLDVGTCSKGAAARRAVVTIFDAHKSFPENKVDARLRTASFFARRSGVDAVFILPKPDLQLVPFAFLDRFVEGGIRVVYSNWTVPPDLSRGVPRESGGCCGAREFLKLVAFGLEEYDAVVVVDNDWEADDFGALDPVFDCAAEGRVVTTRGGHTPVSGSFMAMKPSRALLADMLDTLARVSVTERGGWENKGWGPVTHGFQARMQGFLYYYLYQSDAKSSIQPAQVDSCVFNLQNHLEANCRAVVCANATVGESHRHTDAAKRARRARLCGRRRLSLETLEPTPASGGRAYVSCGSRVVDLQQWLVLAKSIRATGSAADIVFLAFGDDAELATALEQWSKAIDVVRARIVRTTLPIELEDVKGPLRPVLATASHGKSKAWDFVKLRPWQLVQYGVVVFLDADMIVRGTGIDDLFGLASKGFTYSDGPFAPLNAGMFVLRPSLATFDALVDVVREGDFTYERGWRGAGLANGTAKQYKNHASETTQGLFYYWFVQRQTDSEATYVPRAVYNWQVPSDRHDVRSLDGARLAHFTHCGKPPSKVNGRYDACARLHREWRETWARVLSESGVVGEPVTLAYRSTDTLSRTTGTRINRTGRYAWLDHEKWAAYAKELYGPNNATINDMDVIDKALLPPNLQEAPRGCPRSDDEPFKRFNWHAPLSRFRYFRRRTARDPPPPAFRNYSKVEISHCGGSKFETNGAFFYVFRGTGLYIDIGRSLAFETHDDASRYLLGRPCAPGKSSNMQLGIFQCDAELKRIIGAAKSQGWDSLQFTRHCDAFCTGKNMSDALSGKDPRSQLCGFEVVLTRVAGTDACPAGLELFRGWGGHEPCACDASRLRSQRGRCAACAPVTT